MNAFNEYKRRNAFKQSRPLINIRSEKAKAYLVLPEIKLFKISIYMIANFSAL